MGDRLASNAVSLLFHDEGNTPVQSSKDATAEGLAETKENHAKELDGTTWIGKRGSQVQNPNWTFAKTARPTKKLKVSDERTSEKEAFAVQTVVPVPIVTHNFPTVCW